MEQWEMTTQTIIRTMSPIMLTKQDLGKIQRKHFVQCLKKPKRFPLTKRKIEIITIENDHNIVFQLCSVCTMTILVRYDEIYFDSCFG